MVRWVAERVEAGTIGVVSTTCEYHNLHDFPHPQYRLELIIFFASTNFLTNRTLSTLQVLTKLASLNPSHTLRVPTRACCVVPSGRFFQKLSLQLKHQISIIISKKHSMPGSNPHHHHLQPSTQTASSQIFPTSQSESTKQPQICSTYSFFLMLDNNVNVVFGQFYLILQCNIFGSFLSSSYVVEKLSLNVLI